MNKLEYNAFEDIIDSGIVNLTNHSPFNNNNKFVYNLEEEEIIWFIKKKEFNCLAWFSDKKFNQNKSILDHNDKIIMKEEASESEYSGLMGINSNFKEAKRNKCKISDSESYENDIYNIEINNIIADNNSYAIEDINNIEDYNLAYDENSISRNNINRNDDECNDLSYKHSVRNTMTRSSSSNSNIMIKNKKVINSQSNKNIMHVNSEKEFIYSQNEELFIFDIFFSTNETIEISVNSRNENNSKLGYIHNNISILKNNTDYIIKNNENKNPSLMDNQENVDNNNVEEYDIINSKDFSIKHLSQNSYLTTITFPIDEDLSLLSQNQIQNKLNLTLNSSIHYSRKNDFIKQLPQITSKIKLNLFEKTILPFITDFSDKNNLIIKEIIKVIPDISKEIISKSNDDSTSFICDIQLSSYAASNSYYILKYNLLPFLLTSIEKFFIELSNQDKENFFDNLQISFFQVFIDKLELSKVNIEILSLLIDSAKELIQILPSDDIVETVLSTLLLMANDDSNIEKRILSIILFDKFSSAMGSELCEMHVIPMIAFLSEDQHYMVRKAIAFNLINLSMNVSRCVLENQVLSCYYNLCEDSLWIVRKAAAQNLGKICEMLYLKTLNEANNYLDKISEHVNDNNTLCIRLNLEETKNHFDTLMEVFLFFSKDKQQYVKIACLSNIGEFIFNYQQGIELIKKVNVKLNLNISSKTINTIDNKDINFKQEKQLSIKQTKSTKSNISNLSKSSTSEIKNRILEFYLECIDTYSMEKENDIIYICAFQFPSVLLFFGKPCWYKLKNFYTSFSESKEYNIKKTIAGSFKVVCQLLKYEKFEIKKEKNEFMVSEVKQLNINNENIYNNDNSKDKEENALTNNNVNIDYNKHNYSKRRYSRKRESKIFPYQQNKCGLDNTKSSKRNSLKKLSNSIFDNPNSTIKYKASNENLFYSSDSSISSSDYIDIANINNIDITEALKSIEHDLTYVFNKLWKEDSSIHFILLSSIPDYLNSSSVTLKKNFLNKLINMNLCEIPWRTRLQYSKLLSDIVFYYNENESVSIFTLWKKLLLDEVALVRKETALYSSNVIFFLLKYTKTKKELELFLISIVHNKSYNYRMLFYYMLKELILNNSIEYEFLFLILELVKEKLCGIISKIDFNNNLTKKDFVVLGKEKVYNCKTILYNNCLALIKEMINDHIIIEKNKSDDLHPENDISFKKGFQLSFNYDNNNGNSRGNIYSKYKIFELLNDSNKSNENYINKNNDIKEFSLIEEIVFDCSSAVINKTNNNLEYFIESINYIYKYLILDSWIKYNN